MKKPKKLIILDYKHGAVVILPAVPEWAEYEHQVEGWCTINNLPYSDANGWYGMGL